VQVDERRAPSLVDALRRPESKTEAEGSEERTEVTARASAPVRPMPRASSGRKSGGRRRLVVVLLVAVAVAAAVQMLWTLDLTGARGTARQAVDQLGRSNPLVGSALDALGFRRRTLAPGETPVCDPKSPIFVYGFADLRLRVGAKMGEALECERAVHPSGDTNQRTSTGIAYYRKGVNIPSFTNGWEHWALTKDGLLYWTGDVVDPPATTPNP
jgi:hypothetical protein